MRALLLLLGCATVALADEPQPDPATAHLPADAILVIRLAPPERIDLVGREMALAEVTEERRPTGNVILGSFLAGDVADRSKPLYVALGAGGEWTALLPAKPGVTAEQVEALGKGRVSRLVLLADGWIRESNAADPADAATPLPLLPGDVSLVVPVERLLDKHRGKIDEALDAMKHADGLLKGTRVPAGVVKLGQVLGERVLRAATDVADLHYALTWRGGRLESEGWLRSREGTALRRWLEARKGTKPNELMGLLPGKAFWMVESAGTAAALDGDVAALLDEAFGEGAGRTLLALLSPSYALSEHLTGQAAGVITVQGLMAMSMRSVHEIKPGARIADAIAAIDPAKLNRMLQGLEVPLEVRLERGYAKAGETAIHRLTFMTLEPRLGMFAGLMTTCFAVEGPYLLVTQSGLAENEIRALILSVRSSDRTVHPHTTAMDRLMPDRQEGLSINVGALKPVLGMLAMAVPDGARFLNALPDDLWLSTALAVRGGNIHIRGDWPAKEFLGFVAKVKKLG